MTKYVFVTGGVCSGLGKGITASSIALLLKASGYKVFMQKFDPYMNVDPGTMSPIQHGEVFVTDDCKHCNCDDDICLLKAIKVCCSSSDTKKEATMCDSYKKR